MTLLRYPIIVALFGLSLTAMCFALAAPQKGKAPDDSSELPPVTFAASATVSKKQFRTLEPIIVDVYVRNTGKRKLLLPREESVYRSFAIRCFDPKDHPVRRTRYYHEVVAKPSRECDAHVPLLPGRTKHFTVLANLLYDMTDGGDYWLDVEVPVWVDPSRTRPPDATQRTNQVKVNVYGWPIGDL